VVEKASKLHKNKNFILLFTGGFVSRVGNAVHYVALTWFILEITGSGSATGLIMFFSTLPGVILGPFAGVIVDKTSRKFIIVGTDILRGLIILWLSWTVNIGITGYFHLAIATVLLAICGAFFNPALRSTIPNLVEDSNLQDANSLQYFSTNFTKVLGAGIGGLLIASFGIAGVFLINGISFLISALSEVFIEIPPIKGKINSKNGKNNESTFLSELKFGAKYLYKEKAVFSLFGMAVFLNFIMAGSLMVGVPYVFKEILKVNSNLYGISQSMYPAGAFIGALVFKFLSEIKNYYKVFVTIIGLQGVLFFIEGIPILPSIINNNSFIIVYLSAIIILFLIGFTDAVVNVPIKVLLQRLIPDHVRGRIFGLLSSFVQGLVPISMAIVGFLLDYIGGYYLFFGTGILTLILTVLITKVSALKELN